MLSLQEERVVSENSDDSDDSEFSDYSEFSDIVVKKFASKSILFEFFSSGSTSTRSKLRKSG